MTRETKIGLFVGMGMIILIGILLSDYFSEAQKMEHPDFGRAFPESRDAAAIDAEAMSASLPSDNRPLPQPGQLTAARQTDPVRQPEPPADDTGADRLRVDLRPAIADLPAEDRTTRPPVNKKIVLPPGGPFDVVKDGALTAEQIRQVQAAAAGTQVTFHVVQEGETLSEIARRYYGRTAEWRAIYDANKAAIGEPDELRPGIRLQVPNVAAPIGKVATTQAATPAAPAKPQFAEYTLKSGETLAHVAERFYGSQARWRDVYELNKDRVKNPNKVAPGLVLRVPKK